MQTLHPRQHPQVSFIEHDERGLSTILARICSRLGSDLPAMRQHDPRQANVNPRVRFPQRFTRRADVTDSVISVSGLPVLGGETQNLGTLHRLAHRLALLVLVTPRAHLTSSSEMREPHRGERFSHREESSELALGATLRARQDSPTDTTLPSLVDLIRLDDERSELVIEQDTLALNVTRPVTQVSFDPVNDAQAEANH